MQALLRDNLVIDEHRRSEAFLTFGLYVLTGAALLAASGLFWFQRYLFGLALSGIAVVCYLIADVF